MSTYRYKDYFNKDANEVSIIKGYLYARDDSSTPTTCKIELNQYANIDLNVPMQGSYRYRSGSLNFLRSYIQENGLNLSLNISTKHSLYDGITSDSNYSGLLSQKDKIVRDGTDFYKIGIKTVDHEKTYKITEDKDGIYLLTYLKNFVKGFSDYVDGEPALEIHIEYTSLRLTKTPVVEGEYTINYPAKTGHLINKSAPFDIFCIPYSDDMQIQVGSIVNQANKQFAMSIASELGRNLAGNCYDIQLLPYCPMTGYTVIDNVFNINSSDSKRFTAIKKGDQTVYWMFWSTSNSGSFNIQKTLLVENKKIENQCDMYRLVSPNYSGQFEFNLAKNGGVNNFNIDYTYLPVSSYIHVNPDFKELYGNDYNDARGLICQGDFSIMYLSDAWINYQQQNKNYNQIFGREIQNMDINRKYQKTQEIISGIASAAGTGVTLGLINTALGVATGLASAAGAAGDIAINEKLYQEAKSFKKDIHDMQLENIQALPNSIAKTTAYTENNKIFPTLEYYTCTDEEKTLIAKAISNMGMTVNAMGKPQDYINNDWNYGTIQDRGFFKATLIKIDNLNEDYHMAQSIAQELSLGVYIKGE